MNQRVVFLTIVAIDYNNHQLTLRTPPTKCVAVPQVGGWSILQLVCRCGSDID